MANDFLVERAVTEGNGLVEDEHDTIPGRSVRSRLEESVIRVTDIGAGLDQANNGVVAKAASIEIGGLVIVCGFGEVELVKTIMVPVGPSEQLYGGGLLVCQGIELQV